MQLSDKLQASRLLRHRGHVLAATGPNGFFRIPYRAHWLWCISSDGERTGWEHVSVSVQYKLRKLMRTRIPTWEEMCFVKSLFWGPEEVVIQYHPRQSEYINCHEHVLHLWKWTAAAFPTPPPELVGIPGISQEQGRQLAEQDIFFEMNKEARL